ncbi:hypothetical protein OGAPHI_003252 [Ogataea philodendri]|uniref:PHD-type domain-containing protein n=1 Tax=Ogataea philodendri TaxID=1378263 RepID=A0A9P8P6N5_9ASCO|nr:uncharacterized protein OGAPHI_003252 [Ogataea philodendri]KAH3666803.1 hypothetical protein OGAPHI_003252 [Ogataea philodendri]
MLEERAPIGSQFDARVDPATRPKITLPSLSSLGDDFSLPPLNSIVSTPEPGETRITLPSLAKLTESISDALQPAHGSRYASPSEGLDQFKRSPEDQLESDRKRLALGVKQEEFRLFDPPRHRTQSAGPPSTDRFQTAHKPEYVLQNARSGEGDQLETACQIPVFRPSQDQFADPMAYVESLKDIGRKYGAIKVVVPNQHHRIHLPSKFATFSQSKKGAVVSGGYSQFIRKRDLLISLGFQPKFDRSTIHTPGYTTPDSKTLPSYDFYHWTGSEVDDDGALISGISSLEELDRNSERIQSTDDSFFWNNDVQTQFGVEVPEIDYTATGWNLRYLSVCDGSLLRYLNEESSLIQPKLHIGATYSFQAWTMEDHFLQRADYHHSGAVKKWYFIPPSEQEKYEKLRKTTVSDRKKLKNELFREFVSKQDILDDSLIMSPEELKQNGIEVFSTDQVPGEIVVKYPQTYSFNVSLGTTINESVNFASRCWLSTVLASIEWMQSQQIAPNFSTFKFLVNIANNCNDRDTLRDLEPVLDTLVGQEMDRREHVRDLHLKETSTGTANVVDTDLTDAYPSYIVLSDRKRSGESLTMSVAQFLETYDSDSHDYRLEFAVRMSDDALRTTQKVVRSKLVTGAQWLSKYQELISGYDKPSTKLIRPLLTEGESIFPRVDKLDPQDRDAYEVFDQLRRLYRLTEDWVARALKFLQFKVSTRMRQRKMEYSSDTESWNELEDLDRLIKEIPHLPISTPEMDQLLEYSNEIIKYNELVEQLMKQPDEKELESLHTLGASFGVKLDSFLLLDRILKRKQWLRKMETVDFYAIDTPAVAELLEEGLHVGSTQDQETIDKLQLVYAQAMEANRELAKNLGDVQQLQQLYEKYESLPLDRETRGNVVSVLDEYSTTYGQLEQIAQTVQLRFGEIAESDQLLRMIDSNLRYFDSSFNISRPFLAEITQKVAKYSYLVSEHQTLQFYEQQIDVWYEQLVLYFGLSKVKKLRSYFEEWQHADEQIFAEPPGSSNYCVCRQKHENGIMIECEQCEQWFHFGCLGLDEKDESEISGFLCPICDIDMKFKSTRHHLEQTDKKPTLAQLVEFVYWSNSQLTVLPAEYKNILWILRNCYTFKLSISNILENDLEGIRFALRRMEACRVNFEQDRLVLRAKVAELMRLPEVDRRDDATTHPQQVGGSE